MVRFLVLVLGTWYLYLVLGTWYLYLYLYVPVMYLPPCYFLYLKLILKNCGTNRSSADLDISKL